MHSEKSRITMDSHYKLHKWGREIFLNFFNTMLGLIRMGQNQDELGNIDPTSAAKALRGILNSYTFHRVFWESDLTIEQECAQIINIFLNGVKN